MKQIIEQWVDLKGWNPFSFETYYRFLAWYLPCDIHTHCNLQLPGNEEEHSAFFFPCHSMRNPREEASTWKTTGYYLSLLIHQAQMLLCFSTINHFKKLEKRGNREQDTKTKSILTKPLCHATLRRISLLTVIWTISILQLLGSSSTTSLPSKTNRKNLTLK